jgi:putative ABC transport system permease protein
VRTALPRLEFSGLISNGDKSTVFIGVGIDARGEFQTKGPFLKMLSGDILVPGGPEGAPLEVMLGSELARQLKAQPGSVLTLMSTTTQGSLNALDVTVKGVFSLGVPEIDKRALYVDIATAQKLLVTDKASMLAVYLDSTDNTDAARADVQKLFPGYATQTWRDQAFYYVAVRNLYNRIFGLLGAIMVVIVLFAVSNTMAMSVVERTREIGTLRALGTLPAQIVRVFTMEGALIGAAGAGIGVVVGIASALALSVAARTLRRLSPVPQCRCRALHRRRGRRRDRLDRRGVADEPQGIPQTHRGGTDPCLIASLFSPSASSPRHPPGPTMCPACSRPPTTSGWCPARWWWTPRSKS